MSCLSNRFKKRQRLGFRILFLLLFGVGSILAQDESAPDSKSSLIPAAMGVRTDSAGNPWDISADGSIGRVGSTMVNHGLALEINGQEFLSTQPLMTPDGSEFVIFGQPLNDLPGLEVQRRVRLFQEEGILRFVEFFYNGSSRDLVLDVFLKTNFSGNYQTFVSNRGRTEPVILASGETGIVVTPGPGQANRAFLFSLAGRNGVLRPGISAQNRFGLTFQYRLRLGSGESASLMHVVTQVAIPQNFDRQSLMSLFASASLDALLEREQGEEWAAFLVNVTPTEDEVMSFSSGLDDLGVDRGIQDVLAIGPRTRLVGEVSGEEVVIKGPYGETKVPLASVAAIVGGQASVISGSRLFLRDGQIFSAELEIAGLTFDQAGGGRIDLDISSLDRLIMGDEASDADWRESGVAMIETHAGDRLRVENPAAMKFTGVSAWGELPISVDELIWFGPAGRGDSGAVVELLDGSRVKVFLPGSQIKVTTDVLGQVMLDPVDMKAIATSHDPRGAELMRKAGMQATVRVKGNQVLMGDIGNTSIPIVSDGILIETEVSKIRSFQRAEGAALAAGGMPETNPLFEIERWDGGVLSGFVRLEGLSLRVGGRDWLVPLADIESIETPWPLPDAESMRAIENLISLLGNSEWAVREKATRELGAFGYLARPVLQRELAGASDPEVTRRLERILSNLN